MQNEFDNEVKYKLFRNVTEILHPTISKKNISNYKITIDDEILPVRVFYPKRISNLNKIIIYIHGDGKVTNCIGKYSDICKNFSLKTDTLVIAIDYKKINHNYEKMYNDIYDTVKYLYRELIRNNIDENYIFLVGDSTGGNIITGINYLNKDEIPIKKEILIYPTLSLEYFTKSKYNSIDKNNDFNMELISKLRKYFTYISYKKDLDNLLLNPFKHNLDNIPSTLLLVGSIDILKDEVYEYSLSNKNIIFKEIPFAEHGFLNVLDKELEDEVFEEVNKFLL